MNKKVVVLIFVLITILLTSCASAQIGERLVANKRVPLFFSESLYDGSGCEVNEGDIVIVRGYGNDGDEPMYLVEIPKENICFHTELYAYALWGNFTEISK